MSDIPFLDPIILRMPGLGDRKVASSFEALECLERDWPEWARGRQWRNAVNKCRDALEGWRTAKEARRSFAKAAMRAGFIKPAPRRSPYQRPVMPQPAITSSLQ